MPKSPVTQLSRWDQRIPRRQWLLGSLFGAVGLATSRSGWCSPPPETTSAELASILARAKKAKLGDFQVTESKEKQYVGIGDAPADFRADALSICESLAKLYRDYFEAKGFEVGTPESGLIMVILKDKESYKAFVGPGEGADVGAEVGGHYDVDANQLVVFDSRHNDDGRAASKRVNTFTLVHEAIHQLTYNTGLLERVGDVPVALSEGFATFGELWQQSNQRSTLGVTNSARLAVFTQPGGQAAWIPVQELLTKDDLFTDPDTVQVAYAESWVFVHYFMRSTPAKLTKFRAYLDALRKRRDPSHRLEDARTHLGELARLDKDLKQYANKQLRR
ncbi:DUF1570 domain-containing protein [Singulisphaera sp. GP187]|uniref:DUF1570 domain-containing protein n=1 Tax=Singulisphaera sp. GP187 TaxID=1882752 RepID=UPI0009F99F3D|nr:DUF1570 domain-containing protein [Singulisphaera sp. GP187]